MLIGAGLGLAAPGALLLPVGKVPFLERLPGDIVIERGGFRFSSPLATCNLLSIMLSLLLWLLGRR